ncbi:FxSxx-COOH system tetratricopeptide repeat protein [Streptomyces sp. NPDC057877]|uniref:FxSxx-COOH system tetratricopeptide repeat protein n=1 Tax=Streptomyces sp. NPDC057877 TaxID=3346269 RepID=UPI0036C84277
MGDGPDDRTPEPRTRSGRQTVTISFAGFNGAWATWIGSRLEREGHRVAYQRWNPSLGIRIDDALHDLLLAPGQVLLVISDSYLQLGPRDHEEWDLAVREVVLPHEDRFAAVCVTSSALPGALAGFSAPDLTAVGAEEAQRLLLARLGLAGGGPEGPDDAADRLPGPRFPGDVPQVWRGVPRQNTRFTGREQLLSDAYGQMLRTSMVTLYGMPGVGKTQLAAEYAHRFASEYDVVWWVNADRRSTFRQSLAELAPRLGLSTGAEYGERLRAVRGALSKGKPFARWLLVLDGADEPDQVADLVPSGSGHVLITSRNPAWGEHNSVLLEVPVYNRDESVAFVLSRAPRLTEGEAGQLAEALGDLPLLLDQTAGWLSDSDLTIEEYLERLNTGLTADSVTVSADFPLTFRTAWSILLAKLRESFPESVDLLRLCTFFAPGTVPVHLLRTVTVDGVPPHIAGLLTDPMTWNGAIEHLRQYSVVRQEYDRDDPDRVYLYVHRMVHQNVRGEMSAEDRRTFAAVARRALAEADPRRPAETDLWPVYAEIVPHLEHADSLDGEDPIGHELVLNCLRYLYLSGEHGTGARLAEQTRSAWQDCAAVPRETLRTLDHHYANLLRARGEYRRSEAVSRAAVEGYRPAAGTVAGRKFLRALGSLAADLRALGRYDEALDLSEQVARGYERLGDADPQQLLSARNNVAVSLRLLGRYREALDIDRQTSDDRKRLLGPDDVWTLFSGIYWATDLRLLGCYREAAALQERNARDHVRHIGADHPQTLRAEHNLALCRYRNGDRDEAGVLFARALERCERVLGETDPLTLVLAVGNSCFARAYGDIDQARETGESVGRHYERLLGPEHPYTAGARANHALILRDVGEWQQAQVLAEEALATMTRGLGGGHPWTLGCAVNASGLRSLVGDVDSALSLSGETFSRAREALGPTHPLTLSAQVAMAADLRSTGEDDEADRVEESALSGLSRTLGPEHFHTVSARSRSRPSWDFEPQTT